MRLIPLVVLLMGCSIGEATYETVRLPARAASETRVCTGPIAKPVVASLEACGEGRGHCYDGQRSPIVDVPACSGGKICVPDKVLASGGGKLKACTFFIGNKPGACLSTLIASISLHENTLERDVCDADERCAPCINPQNGEDTKICEPIGVYENACTGGPGAAEESCCHGSGVCSNPDAIPADARGDMVRDSCSGNKLCAPASMVDGKPVKCDVAGIDGVCLDHCFAKMMQGTARLMRGGCRATEVCLPCFLGKSRGMPGCE